jgi:hypothetical protein
MVEQVHEVAEPFGAEDYSRLGGMWSEAFEGLMEIVDERETNPIPVRETFIHQAQGMGVYTGLVITPKEAYLYGVLYQKPIGRLLSQQQLLAEVMLVMGNPNKREAFTRFYPQIDFNNSGLQRETSRPHEKIRLAYAERGSVVFAMG